VINANSKGITQVVARICVYSFPAVSLLSTIPIFSIVIKYNLEENKLCRKSIANFWAVIFPWLISVLFYSGSEILAFINWTSLLVNGFINYVVPMSLYIVVFWNSEKKDKDIFEEEEEEGDFTVLPEILKPTLIAIFLTTLIFLLLIFVIIINILEEVGINPF